MSFAASLYFTSDNGLTVLAARTFSFHQCDITP